MAEKVERDFMNILRRGWLARCFQIALLFFLGCSPDMSDDQIPYQPFADIVLNLNLPENFALKNKGSVKLLNGGVRGIIVYCQDPGVYRAYERNCSFHPNDACATVNVDNSNLFMVDPCCNSSFEFSTGNPTGGAAWRPLQQYRATYNGIDLIISDEVIQ